MSLVDTYHAYVFGTAFWYALRAFVRLVSPATVVSWFRPPVDSHLVANDLELYTTWTDAFGLLSLAALLVVLADAVPLPHPYTGSSLTQPTTARAKLPYARAAVIVTMFHHVTTGYGAYQHWAKPSHHNIAMDIGFYGNIGLTMLGFAALYFGLGADGSKRPGDHRVKKPTK